MINWNEIKNNIGELNGNNILSPKDNKPLDNELIMCLFCNKINLKYRFEPYYEIPFIEYNTRIFDTVISGFDEDNITSSSVSTTSTSVLNENNIISTSLSSSELIDNFKNTKNFFDVAKNDKMIITYILSIKNIIITQIKIVTKSDPEKIKKLINEPNINTNDINIYDYITNNFDINLILVSALENMDLRKYKILSEMLYNIDNKYLDYAKESIINSNKNISLDKMVYKFDLPTKKDFEFFTNNSNYIYINFILILLIVLIFIIFILQIKGVNFI
jgi:hypothetical protein